eukprot:TRINITY_DN2677_c0_g1_i1.p1 TRINITY_DN2677_c0_g1~~TRINITY_DN2677_c0_g1_i1.p1  ORF type:complete len:186 (+),score=29.78 TRINITY_DN2677_c0_g1_i1:648-1205(+)
MSTLSNALYKFTATHSLKKWLIIAVIAYVCMATAGELLNLTKPLLVLDLRWAGFTVEEAYEYISLLGEEGRFKWVAFTLILDLIVPGVLGIALAMTLCTLYPYTKDSISNYFPLVPIVSILCDYTENACSIWMTTHYPEIYPTVAKIDSFAVTTKWIAFFMSLILVSTGLLSSLFSKTKKPSKKA